MPDPFSLLKDDHRKVERLFEQFEQSQDPSVALQISQELTVHSIVEEELVYPILATKVEFGKAEEARHEHDEAKQLILQMESQVAAEDAEGLTATVQQLKEAIQHHVEEEEREVFPLMEQKLSDTTPLLGPDMEARKEKLLIEAAKNADAGMPPSALGHKTTV